MSDSKVRREAFHSAHSFGRASSGVPLTTKRREPTLRRLASRSLCVCHVWFGLSSVDLCGVPLTQASVGRHRGRSPCQCRHARDGLEHEAVAEHADALRPGKVRVEDEERKDLGGAPVVKL